MTLPTNTQQPQHVAAVNIYTKNYTKKTTIAVHGRPAGAAPGDAVCALVNDTPIFASRS
jgi:hypothetical protein